MSDIDDVFAALTPSQSIMPIFRLSEKLIFPPVHLATDEGLLAVGGDLSAERLLLAYQEGIFPWYSESDPLLWWSPDPRLVLFPDELIISRSLHKTLRQQRFETSMDTNFQDVISACAGIRRKNQDGTWITHEMLDAYLELHRRGYAHSVEIWQDDRIVGGLYGLSLGRCFFGESMFATRSDASKVALVHLCRCLRRKGFGFIDCQVHSDHLCNMGARPIARSKFIKLLSRNLTYDTLRGSWRDACLGST